MAVAARQGSARHGWARLGTAVEVGRGLARRGLERRGWARLRKAVMEGSGTAWLGEAGLGGHGTARQGLATQPNQLNRGGQPPHF